MFRGHRFTWILFCSSAMGSVGSVSPWDLDVFSMATQDKRLAWFDMDLSTKPYRSLRYHSQALRGVAFHARHPLFASASDDGSVNVFHGMVYQVSPAAPKENAGMHLPSAYSLPCEVTC